MKDDVYEQSHTVISKALQHDMLVIMGDLNAIGSDNTDAENIMDSQGCVAKMRMERTIDLIFVFAIN